MQPYNIRTLEDNLARVDEDLANSIKYYQDQAVRSKERITRNYQAAALLDGAGIDMGLSQYSRMEYLKVNLGRRTDKQRVRLLRTIREILGCPLRYEGKEAAGTRGQWITVRLVPADYPNITITYDQKLPRLPGVKCRIVSRKTVTRQLVCEVS